MKHTEFENALCQAKRRVNREKRSMRLWKREVRVPGKIFTEGCWNVRSKGSRPPGRRDAILVKIIPYIPGVTYG